MGEWSKGFNDGGTDMFGDDNQRAPATDEEQAQVHQADDILDRRRQSLDEEDGQEAERSVSFKVPAEKSLMDEVREDVVVATESEECPELYLEEYFRDHFSLSTPSTFVRFRSTHRAARVFENKTTQFILEETIDEISLRRRIHVKQLSDGTNGLQFLRLVYTIMCVFWTGVFFVFCLQVLLVMVLDMAIEVGSTNISAELHPGTFVGLVIGIFVFCYSFSQGLVIAGAFVGDAWTGHYLIKLFFFKNRYGNVLVDWVFFCFFVLFPILVMCITLLMRREDWWAITLLFWYACVSLFFLVFAVNSVFFEVQGALSFLSKRSDMSGKVFWGIVKECVLLRQRSSYSGYKTSKYLARSATLTNDSDGLVSEDSILEWSKEERSGPWARITKLGFLSTASQSRRAIRFFSPVDPPQPLYTIDDVQDYRPYVTKHTWSLERLFCRPRNSRYIVIVGGPGALTKHQMRSSLICSVIGMALFFLLLLSLLVYMEIPALSIFAAMVVGALASIPLLKDLRRQIRVTKRVFQARDEEKQKKKRDGRVIEPPANLCLSRRESEISEEPNEGMFLVAQQARVTLASDVLCWIATAAEIIIFYMYPMITLFYVRNFQLGGLFIVVATVSLVRHYVNLVAVVEETGQFSLISGKTVRIRWSKQSRLNDLIEAISYNKSRRFWQLILGFCGIFWLAIFFSASGQSFEPTTESSLTFVDGFAWTPQPDDVRYGTCNLTKTSTFGANGTLADFAFLSGLPYKQDGVAESQLQEWFNKTTEVREDPATVQEFRKRNGFENSPVFFRLYRFKLENGKDRGVISIRGTQNSWDILADFQLWSAAMLAQGIRAVLPVGKMWTPILDDIVFMLSLFQKGAVDAVSFYKVTTPFALELKADASFDSIQITGHSLGGGLAMISSAQSRVPSVALSGPNAMISGKSFEPQVSHDELDRYTFNIVPDRDMVPRFDDLAQNYQRIRCSAAPNKFMSCHAFARSLCEIVYTCGNQDRPTICDCVYEFKYPEPISLDPNAASFFDACEAKGYVKPDYVD